MAFFNASYFEMALFDAPIAVVIVVKLWRDSSRPTARLRSWEYSNNVLYTFCALLFQHYTEFHKNKFNNLQRYFGQTPNSMKFRMNEKLVCIAFHTDNKSCYSTPSAFTILLLLVICRELYILQIKYSLAIANLCISFNGKVKKKLGFYHG